MKFLPLLLLLVSFYSFAQNRIYRNYTVEDGLPSSEVYYSFQDSKGYMWFATDAGVSRFNGYEFENFTTENGLTDNTVFKITEDAKGRVWFAPFNGQFCYYFDGKIYEYEYNSDSKELHWIRTIMDFYIDSLDNIWIGTREKGIIKVNKEGVKNLSLNKGDELSYNHFKKVNNSFIISHFISNKGFSISNVIDYNKTSKTKFITSYIDLNEKKSLKKAVNLTRVKENSLTSVNSFTSFGNKVAYDFHNKLLIHDLKEYSIKPEVYDLPFFLEKELLFLKLLNNELWASVRGQGVYRFSFSMGKLEMLDHYFEKSSISSMSKDDSKSLWFTSLTKGVYFIPNDNVTLYDFHNESIFQLEADTVLNVLYTNFVSGKFYCNDLVKRTQHEVELPMKLNRIKLDQQSNVVFSSKVFNRTNVALIGFKDGCWEVFRDNLNYSSFFKDFILEKDTFYLVNHVGVHVFTDDYEFVSYNGLNKEMWSTSIKKYGDGFIVGTKKGLMFYKNQTIKQLFKNEKKLTKDITCIEKIKDSVFVIGTKQHGLVIIKNGKILKVIDESNGLLKNLVRTVHCDNKQNIWVGTSNGLNKVTNFLSPNPKISSLTKIKGLPSNEITDIKSIKDTLYVGTAKGLVTINTNDLFTNEKPPPIFIISNQVNKLNKSKIELNSLGYKENNLKIIYEALNYKSQGKINYKYRLIGNGTDTTWVLTQSRMVQYTLLPPSDYLFEVKAENEDGYWSKPAQLTFSISPPFWNTWWFRILTILIFSLIIYWLIALSFKRREKVLIEKKEKAELEKKMIDLELMALRSQMNPHFIFNILNSIQHYMLQNDFKQTNRYLTQFAKLIRTVLNLSEKNIITIGEEVEMLRLYMNLEKMRFENGFDFEIEIGEEVDEGYDEIPSMLIQPYVENAIWHGLMNKQAKGKIIVSIIIEDNYLCCSVEDNGIGIRKAKEIKAQRKNLKHKSVGMRITKSRLDILNDENEVSVKIIDLESITPKRKGTRVEIKIPYNS